MTPMVVFDTIGIVSGETGGHVPATYMVAPVIGALFVGLLWYNLAETSFKLGLIWTVLGVLYPL